MTSQKNKINLLGNCDVVVIGGGLAALSAAISAADNGASVLLVNKGTTGKSGSSAKAAGIFSAAFGHGDLTNRSIEDSAEQHALDTLRIGFDIGDSALVRHITNNAQSAVHWLEKMGVEFSKANDGGYVQLNAPGNSCPRGVSAVGGGNTVMEKLIKQADQRGVLIINETIARSLLIKSGIVHGVSFHGTEQYIVETKAVILAAGGATGMFPSISGDSANIGSSLMLGYDSGALLGNLEFIEFTLIYRVHGQILRIAGMAPFLSRGGKLFNRNGDDLFDLHFPNEPAEQVGRAEILRMVEGEIIANRGPVMLDCRHFNKATWAEFQSSQGSTTLNKIAAAGCNPKIEPIEVVPAAHSALAGLIIDCKAQTNVRGLFVAGENATGIHGAGRLSGNGLTACTVMGLTAGKTASNLAIKTKRLFTLSKTSREALAKAIMLANPLNVSTPPMKLLPLIEQVRQLVGQSLGIIRNDTDLNFAKHQLENLKSKIGVLNKDNKEVFEAHQMTRLACMMTQAAFDRKESRGVQFKSDHQSMKKSWNRSQLFNSD